MAKANPAWAIATAWTIESVRATTSGMRPEVVVAAVTARAASARLEVARCVTAVMRASQTTPPRNLKQPAVSMAPAARGASRPPARLAGNAEDNLRRLLPEHATASPATSPAAHPEVFFGPSALADTHAAGVRWSAPRSAASASGLWLHSIPFVSSSLKPNSSLQVHRIHASVCVWTASKSLWNAAAQSDSRITECVTHATVPPGGIERAASMAAASARFDISRGVSSPAK
mmetsp:Transcript_46613/g.122399  ORF Transcript_46613/g.122399 Transcript_46613/m.122399 type:complete len:231 (-) Transcript_46613:62-754(-)